MLIFDVYLFFIVFFVKKTLVLFIRHINTFFKNNAILVINKLSFVDISINSFFIALKIAKLIEKRMRFRSKLVKSLLKRVSKYCVGVYVQCVGRISDSNIARKDKLYVGSISLNTVNFFVSYGLVIANTIKGLQSIKVWIHVY
jgi:ribosomal protein S3